MPALRDLAGQTLHHLTVISRVPNVAYSGNAMWRCRCACGTVIETMGSRLLNGNTKSCGCLQRATIGQLRRTHHQSRTTEYEIWSGIKKRCCNPKSRAYPNYGGRGITICERWQHSFVNFLADVGLRPSSQHTIDRIDNDGHYEPDNVRWANKFQQANNTRSNHRLTFRGETLTIAEWGRRLNLSRQAIKDRLRWQWTVERALTTPVK